MTCGFASVQWLVRARRHLGRSGPSRLPLAMLMLAASCGGSPTSPKEPTPVRESFSGVVLQESNIVQPFDTTEFGNVTVTLERVSPSISIGLRISTRDPQSCGSRDLARNDRSQVGTVLRASGVAPGTYCFILFDVGTIPGRVEFTAVLERPS